MKYIVILVFLIVILILVMYPWDLNKKIVGVQSMNSVNSVKSQLRNMGVPEREIESHNQGIEDNLKIIESHNKKNGVQSGDTPIINYGVTKFVMYPKQEFLKLFTGLIYPSGPLTSPEPSHYKQIKFSTEPPAQTVRWDTNQNSMNRNVMPEIKDQGQCGSCWVYTACTVMSSQIIMEGGTSEYLSVNHGLNCVKNCDNCNGACLGCQGGFPAYVFSYAARIKGAQVESTNPYLSRSNLPCDKVDVKFEVVKGIGFRPDIECVEVLPNGMENFCNYRTVVSEIPNDNVIKIIQNMINTYGPFSLCINAENLGLLAAPYTTSCPGGQINHAVVLIGYDYKNNQNGQKSLYWVIRNSWGTNWGDNGCFYAEAKSSYIAGIEAVKVKLL
jgi:hypothetical protein